MEDLSGAIWQGNFVRVADIKFDDYIQVKSSVYGIPTLDYTEVLKMCRNIVAGRRPYIFNDENWGLGQESLEESAISTADWDKENERN